MALTATLQGDLQNAMKAKDGAKVAVLRLLIAALKNRRIELGKDLTDEQVLEIVASSVKRRHESIEMFRQGGRQDLVAEEEAGLAILKGYLPAQLSDDELRAIISAAIASSGVTSASQVGMVMKVVMPQIKGKADGKAAKEMAEKLLAGG